MLSDHIHHMYECLSAFQHEFPIEDIKASYALLGALERERVSFRVEPWHVLDHADTNYPSHVCELLFNAEPGERENLDFAKADALFRRIGCGPDVDTLIFKIALPKAKAADVGPVSVNIGTDSLIKPVFWADIEPVLTFFGHENVVVEILEHDMSSHSDLSGMLAAQKKGVRIAIDDFQPCERDWKRLSVVGSYSNFVKLDGKYLEEVANNPDALQETIQTIKRMLPQVSLVAEWVDDVGKACSLRERFGIVHFQGKSLPPAGHDIYSPRRSFDFAI